MAVEEGGVGEVAVMVVSEPCAAGRWETDLDKAVDGKRYLVQYEYPMMDGLIEMRFMVAQVQKSEPFKTIAFSEIYPLEGAKKR